MDFWGTAQEYASMRLPGLPATKRGINLYAAAHGWNDQKHRDSKCRRRNGRGGGLEYHCTLLPGRALNELILRAEDRNPQTHADSENQPSLVANGGENLAADVLPPFTLRDDPRAAAATGEIQSANSAQSADSADPVRMLWDSFERRPQSIKDEAARRLVILRTVDAFIRDGMTKDAAVRAVVEAGCGDSAPTVSRWASFVRGLDQRDWLPALAPAYRGCTVQAEIPLKYWNLFKADYLRQEAPSATSCYDRGARRAKKDGAAELPSYRTFLRRLQREVPWQTILLAREGEHALKRAYPHQERDRSVFHAMEAVNADGHRWDLFIRWNDGEIRRPCMVVIQDLFSGKILSWRVDKSENQDSVRLAVYDLLRAYGIAGSIYLDNGRGFAAKWLSGQSQTRFRFTFKPDEPAGIFKTIGMEPHWTTPYWGQAKPIERAFRDFCDYIAKHPAFAGAYVGNAPDAKPENYGSRAVDLEVFLRVCEEEIAAHNARLGRRSKVCAGRSFDQVFAESYAANAMRIRRPTQAQLRICLLAADGVTVSKQDGTIHLAGNRYWSEPVAAHRGARVIVRFDPETLKAGLEVFTLKGEYVGLAECLVPAGFNDTGSAREHSRLRREFMKNHRRNLEIEKQLTDVELAQTYSPDSSSPNGAAVPAAPETKVARLYHGPDWTREVADHRADRAAGRDRMLEKLSRFAATTDDDDQEAVG